MGSPWSGPTGFPVFFMCSSSSLACSNAWSKNISVKQLTSWCATAARLQNACCQCHHSQFILSIYIKPEQFKLNPGPYRDFKGRQFACSQLCQEHINIIELCDLNFFRSQQATCAWKVGHIQLRFRGKFVRGEAPLFRDLFDLCCLLLLAVFLPSHVTSVIFY
jgi:hypothetical protein